MKKRRKVWGSKRVAQIREENRLRGIEELRQASRMSGVPLAELITKERADIDDFYPHGMTARQLYQLRLQVQSEIKNRDCRLANLRGLLRDLSTVVLAQHNLTGDSHATSD